MRVGWGWVTLLVGLSTVSPAAGQVDARVMLTKLVGHSKAEVIQALGPPADTLITVDGERMFYETLDAGQFGGRSGDNSRAGGRGDAGLSLRSYAFRCRTEVVIREGRMQAFNRVGNDCR